MNMIRTVLLLLLTGTLAKGASVTLVWDASPTPNVGYRIYQATHSNFSPVLFTTNVTATVLNVSESMPTRFYVTAFTDAGESVPSNTITYTPLPGTPSPPTNLSLRDLQGNRRQLNWMSDPTTSTVIEKSIESDPFTVAATVAPGTAFWVEVRARNKTTRYRIKSCKALCSTWAEITWRP